jgi:hypothetical protein
MPIIAMKNFIKMILKPILFKKVTFVEIICYLMEKKIQAEFRLIVLSKYLNQRIYE